MTMLIGLSVFGNSVTIVPFYVSNTCHVSRVMTQCIQLLTLKVFYLYLPSSFSLPVLNSFAPCYVVHTVDNILLCAQATYG